MQAKILTPAAALNKAYLKAKTEKQHFEAFKTSLRRLLSSVRESESEEFNKNLLKDFLRDTFLKDDYFINTRDRCDLVIHNGGDDDSEVAVIIEVKRPSNKAEMPTKESLNKKAFHELVLYYLRERITHKNVELKYLIVTNLKEWFVFDAVVFEDLIASNQELVANFNSFEAGRTSGDTTSFFYSEIAAPVITNLEKQFSFTYFNLEDYSQALEVDGANSAALLVPVFKLFSPEHLLKVPFSNDSNSLNKSFYSEFLYILGLAEVKGSNKKYIERRSEDERYPGSLLENTIHKLQTSDVLANLPRGERYGSTETQQLFNVALELVITWVNRILFVKLLEAQLLSYHRGDQEYEFLNSRCIPTWDVMNDLFFSVLARPKDERDRSVKDIFASVPYLNSTLFEVSPLERQTIHIGSLGNARELPLFGSTVLKDPQGKRRQDGAEGLSYLLEFLSAFDFGSEGASLLEDDNRPLISASVLGLIFEKINGYKDGSFYTPGYVTMHVCREVIRKAIVERFNEEKQWNCQDFADLYNHISDKREANDIVNSVRICDPAVGSGHFLVSALNEIIAAKRDLDILIDREGKTLRDYDVAVINDELVVSTEYGTPFRYLPGSREGQRVQETLFFEKQLIIETCLFGVDINPNSVSICRLRLWIELLKNSFYRSDGQLETLPNIDINIKCGNSLIRRFGIDGDMSSRTLQGDAIEAYRDAVRKYQSARGRKDKQELESAIAEIKTSLKSAVANGDPTARRLRKLMEERRTLQDQGELFEVTKKEQGARRRRLVDLNKQIAEISSRLEAMDKNSLFDNAMEWRFEFPEVLNHDASFEGFDVVVGNPPFGISRGQAILDDETSEWRTIFGSLLTGKVNRCHAFLALGQELLRPNGICAFVTPNAWLGIKDGMQLRQHFLSQMRILDLHYFTYRVFEDANVEVVIFTVQRAAPRKDFTVFRHASPCMQKGRKSLVQVDQCLGSPSKMIPLNWKDGVYEILSALRRKHVPMCADDSPFIPLIAMQPYAEGKGIPAQTKEDAKKRVFHGNTRKSENSVPFLEGRDVSRFKIKWSGEYIEHGEWLADPQALERYSQSRVVVREILSPMPFRIIAGYLEHRMIYTKSILHIISKNKNVEMLKALTVVLNSKVASFVVNYAGRKADRKMFPKLLLADLADFPVPLKLADFSSELAALFDEVNLVTDVESGQKWQQLMDQKVFECYQLNEAEISYIEKKGEA